jgi:hypothetical protein
MDAALGGPSGDIIIVLVSKLQSWKAKVSPLLLLQGVTTVRWWGLPWLQQAEARNEYGKEKGMKENEGQDLFITRGGVWKPDYV